MCHVPKHSDFCQDIHDFHQKFGLMSPDGPTSLDPELRAFRIKFMQEELDEYVNSTTLEDQFDALIDLVYVALGTAYLHGFPFPEGWARVQAANMTKVRGTKATSKRGSDFDVVKPPGWTPPVLTDLVKS